MAGQVISVPSSAPREGLVTKHSSRGHTHCLIPASCRQAGPASGEDTGTLHTHAHTHTRTVSLLPMQGARAPLSEDREVSSPKDRGERNGADTQRTPMTVKPLTENLLEPLVSADRETEAHREEVGCPRPHNQNSPRHEGVVHDGH